MDYAVLWGILIGVALFIYMTLDGFDLGIGILFPFGLTSKNRENMMNSIAPIWDTNETWLVLAAGGMYGVFPKAYVFIFNALYIPLIAMLICLIFRGVSFEFRFKSPERFRFVWSTLFFLGSLGASLCQGMILGQLIQGFQTIDGNFNQDYWGWLNGFNLCVGGFVVLFYAFMGANFLIYRLKNDERQRFISVSKRLLSLVVVCFVLLGYFVYNIEVLPAGKHLLQRFQTYHSLYTGIGAIITLLVVKLYRTLNRQDVSDSIPFIYGAMLLGVVFFGTTFLGWPYIVSGVHTIWQASSLPETQKLMFVGASVFLPLIFGYSIYNFYIFRGKVADQNFYH